MTCRVNIKEYIKQNYRRIYRASLALTDVNIAFAIEAYRIGVENNVGPTTASRMVQQRYGRPVYTRLANFLRETRLWLVREGRWAYIVCQLTASYKYQSKKKGLIRARITVSLPIPLSADLVDQSSLARYLLDATMAFVGFPWELITELEEEDVTSIRTGLQITDITIEQLGIFINDTVVFPADLEVEYRNRVYTYREILEERKEVWREWWEFSE